MSSNFSFIVLIKFFSITFDFINFKTPFNIPTTIFLITSLVSKSSSMFALSKSIVNPLVSTSVISPLSFLTKKKGSFRLNVDIFAKKFFGSGDKNIYFPLTLSPALRSVISTPIFLSMICFLVVINDSNEILYMVRSSMYPLVSFLIKSLGRSIDNLLSQSRRFKSSGFRF